MSTDRIITAHRILESQALKSFSKVKARCGKDWSLLDYFYSPRMLKFRDTSKTVLCNKCWSPVKLPKALKKGTTYQLK